MKTIFSVLATSTILLLASCSKEKSIDSTDPDGPGSGRFKRNRDSEALVRDSLGRGWWVAFENRHQLWLFDPSFGRALQRIDLGRRGWAANRGIEGLATDGDALLLLHEDGGHLLRVTGTRARSLPIAGARGRGLDQLVAELVERVGILDVRRHPRAQVGEVAVAARVLEDGLLSGVEQRVEPRLVLADLHRVEPRLEAAPEWRPPSESVSFKSGREARHAGMIPKRTPVSTDITAVKARTVVSSSI